MQCKIISSESNTEKTRLEAKVKELETSNQELQAKSEKLLASYELIQRQREDAENSSKRVIANLRDRVKTLTDNTSHLQSQLMDSKIARELREREFSELLSNF